jgi:hypothetical protein
MKTPFINYFALFPGKGRNACTKLIINIIDDMMYKLKPYPIDMEEFHTAMHNKLRTKGNYTLNHEVDLLLEAAVSQIKHLETTPYGELGLGDTHTCDMICIYTIENMLLSQE